MSQSSEADIKAVIEPYAPAFASPKALEQFVKINSDLAEVSPSLLPELVKARLGSDEYQHFLRPPQPQYAPGSIDAIEAAHYAKNGRTVGLGGVRANSSVVNPSSGLASHGAGVHQPAPVLSVEQLSDLYLQRRGEVLSASPGLGGQRNAKPTK